MEATVVDMRGTDLSYTHDDNIGSSDGDVDSQGNQIGSKVPISPGCGQRFPWHQ